MLFWNMKTLGNILIDTQQNYVHTRDIYAVAYKYNE